MTDTTPPRRLRSRDWFDNRERMDMTALYLERFMNYGVTPMQAASPSNFPSTRSSRIAVGRQRRWIATCSIWASWSC